MLTLVLSSEAVATTGSAWEPRASMTSAIEAWTNTNRAANPGSWWNALVEPTFEYRGSGTAAVEQGWLAKGRWLVARNEGSAFEAGTGAFNPVSSIAANHHTRLTNLYYWRHWAGGRFRLKAGQLAIDDDFMVSEFAAALLHSAFGAMPSQVATPLAGDAAYAVYPLATPGLWFSAAVTPELRCQTGLYNGAAGRDTAENHGWEWQRSTATGVVVFSELRWQRNAHGPAVCLGASYHTGHHENFAALRHSSAAPAVHALWNTYAMFDAPLTRHADGSARLGLFARVGLSPQQDRSAVRHYADAGITWRGPWPGRPRDVLAVRCCSTWFASAYRALAGLQSNETTTEITYRIQCSAYLALQADVQRLRPGGTSSGSVAHRSTTIMGGRAVLQF